MTVNPSTINTDVYTAISALLIANKPNYEYKGDTFTYDILSEYHNKDAAFPQIVLKITSKPILINLDRSGEDYDIEVQLDLYAKEKHGKNAVDDAMDELMALFIASFSSLETNNQLIPMEEFWDPSPSAVFEDDNQVLNTVSAIVKFKLK